MMKFRFPIVIIDEDFRSENASGLGVRALAAAIEKEGMEVLGVTSYGDLSQFAQQQSRASAFIRALLDYAQDGSYSWHCPGHSGGVAFLKSPVGQMFHQFFGENMLRADVCNSVDELGQLLDHSGPVAAAERNTARIFNADHCFFVTNGTSTSNMMVWHANVAPNDIVVVDRHCHVSILHAITMTGAIPVFLPPTRNHLGIIGPIPLDEFKPESIKRRIEANSFARNAANKKPRILTLTQSTYAGIAHNVEMPKPTSNKF